MRARERPSSEMWKTVGMQSRRGEHVEALLLDLFIVDVVFDIVSTRIRDDVRQCVAEFRTQTPSEPY